DPLEDDTEIGPVINTAAAERLSEWVNQAVEAGATLLTGGTYEGLMFQPTILENVTQDMQVMCAEAFGPIVNLLPFSDFEAVLDAVNDSDFGLQAGVYTPDLSRAMLATQRLN